MKQLIIIASICFFTAGATKAQVTGVPAPVVNSFNTITEIPLKPGKTEGTVYLQETWRPGTIYLKTGQNINGYHINYDVEHDVIEIETKDGIKVLPGNKAAKFTIWNGFKTDSLAYVNCDVYSFKNIRHQGFYQVLQDGSKLQLLARTDVEVQKANYNAIMDTGSKNDRIIKKEKVYAAAGKQVLEVKSNDDFEIFGAHQEALKNYAKTHKLKLKRKEDAARLIAYYNSI